MIVCLGDLMLDVLVQHRDGPDAWGVLVPLAVQPGGSAANVAAWLAHLGVPAGFIGAAGADLVGDALIEDLHRRGVTCAVARLPSQPTGILLIETLPDGTARPAARRGANDALGLDDAQRHLLHAVNWLHVSAYALYAETSRGPVLEAIALARKAGARISLDLGAPHLVDHIGKVTYRDLLHAVAPDLLLGNDGEAALLTGSGRDPLEALAEYALIAVLKRGAAGCLVRAGNGDFSVAGQDADQIDPTGAGDAFAAGLIGALVAGQPIEVAAAAGVQLGAACVRVFGGRPPLEVA